MIEYTDDLFEFSDVWELYQYFEAYTQWEKLGDAFGNKVPSLGRVFDLEYREFEPIAEKWLKLIGNPKVRRCLYNAFTYMDCPKPHTDSHSSQGITYMIYCNPDWHAGMGGETIFLEDGEIVKSIVPKFGRMVKFTSELWHGARPPLRDAPMRYRLVYQTHPVEPETMRDLF